MAGRTRIVCLCEGIRGGSIDEVFINRLLKSLEPRWIRPHGSNVVRLVPCGGRTLVLEAMPRELKNCLAAGGETTLMVWADCDDDCSDGDELKSHFWKEARRQGITQAQFDQAVFIFAKDRIENWIEFLMTGNSDESREAPRVRNNREAADAAKKLADLCKTGKPVADMPPSLQWSCGNWQSLARRMQHS